MRTEQHECAQKQNNCGTCGQSPVPFRSRRREAQTIIVVHLARCVCKRRRLGRDHARQSAVGETLTGVAGAEPATAPSNASAKSFTFAKRSALSLARARKRTFSTCGCSPETFVASAGGGSCTI